MNDSFRGKIDMSAKKLRADPDDQPPIEERSIMMPHCSQSLRLFPGPSTQFLEHTNEEHRTLSNCYGYFRPRVAFSPCVCSINIILDFCSNAKCNFPARTNCLTISRGVMVGRVRHEILVTHAYYKSSFFTAGIALQAPPRAGSAKDTAPAHPPNAIDRVRRAP